LAGFQAGAALVLAYGPAGPVDQLQIVGQVEGKALGHGLAYAAYERIELGWLGRWGLVEPARLPRHPEVVSLGSEAACSMRIRR